MTTDSGTDVRTILFFDGVCGLCNGFVDFLLARDRRHRLTFAPLQGPTAASLLPRIYTETLETRGTVVLIDQGKTYTQSSAAIRTVALLGRGWTLVLMLLIVPRPIRDGLYRGVARYRYRLFGRRPTCRLPSSAEKPYFLD